MTRRRDSIAPSRMQVALLAILIASASWAGLLYLTYAWPPSGAMLPAFFLILFLAMSASATPFALLLDARLRRSSPRPGLWRPIRQGMWMGVWGVLCAWLQLIQLLDWVTAILFVVILFLVEWFVISRK